jgi:type 1 fimbriae regulatory protein FimB
MEPRQNATPPPEIPFLTQDEVRRLFAVGTGKRDRALFQLAYHHGLRASEVSLLQRDDIHEKQGRIYIPRVKGSIAKTYPLQPDDLRCLRAYLRTREDDSPHLFISTRGIPLERRSYGDLMQTYGHVADIPKPKRRFHALRHAIAVHLLDAGADVAFVQDRLGHANIQNTMVYMRYTTVTRDAQTRQLFASHRVV